MRFNYSNNVVRLVSVRKVISSKNGKEFYFAKVYDLETYESNDYMINFDECKPDRLVAGMNYMMDLIVDGRFSSIVLTPASNL